jgi:hypothetical protein
VHAPAAQTLPAVQVVPHAPQLFGSLWRSAQTPWQLVLPPLHTHCPAVHVWLDEQVLPQLPQLFESVPRFTQLPPHGVVPLGHARVQVPRSQSCPLAHAVPHAPQFLESFEVSTQTLPHSCPTSH